MIDDLHKTGIYVSPDMLSVVTPEEITERVRGSHIKVYAVVAKRLPLPYRSVGQWANDMYGFLHAGPGICVIVASTDVGFHSPDIDKKSEQNLILGASRTFDSEGYAAGIAQIVRNVDYLRAARRRARLKNALLGFSLLVVIAGAVAMGYRQREKERLNNARAAVRHDASQLMVSVKAVDHELAEAIARETDESRRETFAHHRARLREILKGVRDRLDAAHTPPEIEATRAGLGEAEAEMMRASASLQNASGHPAVVEEVPAPEAKSAPVEVPVEAPLSEEVAATESVAVEEESPETKPDVLNAPEEVAPAEEPVEAEPDLDNPVTGDPVTGEKSDGAESVASPVPEPVETESAHVEAEVPPAKID